MSWCPSCCGDCFVTHLSREEYTSDSPFALKNLFAAGTITIGIGVEAVHRICDHRHAEDGWHTFKGNIIPYVSTPDDIPLCQELDILLVHQFILATYSVADDWADGRRILVRIYIVPWDLPNVQGKLRTRKRDLTLSARRFMGHLLPLISTDRDNWYGKGQRYESPLLPHSKDIRKLADIYGDLPSPQVKPILGYGNIANRLLDFNDNLEGLGMRSTLYRYQRESVAAMLQRELDVRDVPNPLFIQLCSMDGKIFHIQPGTTEFLREQPMVGTSRGGILCEELGTGKTVMIISLVVATLNQLPGPEPSIVDSRHVTTGVALRHFPSEEMATMRARASYSNSKNSSQNAVPSLVELLLHQIKTTPFCDVPSRTTQRMHDKFATLEEKTERLSLSKLLSATIPFYHHYSNLEPTQRKQRKGPVETPKTIYLSRATLIIVPPNLVSQWHQEIMKHTAIALRVMVLTNKGKLPSVQALASEYDIILMAYTRFTAEFSTCDNAKLHAQPQCRCPSLPGSRVPNCVCQVKGVSPFHQIRWKRLVIDEGHVSASLDTLLVPLTKKLSIERRWIVTGTPTTNLLGLSFGTNSTQTSAANDITIDDRNSLTDTSTTSVVALSATSSLSSSHSLSSSSSSNFRVWTKDDRQDLNKLGNMIQGFVALPQFTADRNLMTSCITEPLLNPTGPRPGAIQVLNQLMELVMIRHRISDVEQDVTLPPVTQKHILLDLDPLSIKSYNALQASIVVNAVDSERKDQDYLFHPRNADLLQQTVKNMSQILFWSVDDNMYNSVELLKSAAKDIETAKQRGRPDEDIRLLEAAFKHIALAADDPLWKLVQQHEDIPYRIFDLNPEIYAAWTRPLGRDASITNPSHNGFIHANRLLKLRELVQRRPLASAQTLAEYGAEEAKEDEAIRQETEKRSRHKRGTARQNAEDASHSQMVDKFAKKASANETLKEMEEELGASMKRRDKEEDMSSGLDSLTNGRATHQYSARLISHSQLTNVSVGSSGSSKLNYILDEVLKYSPTEKILIFSESALTLAHVAEGLDLVGVKYLHFTTQVPASYRQKLVLTFETSDLYRVFLMELKHGARGLNLVSASRVLFCEPVWQADVESQAIKRAHRIGQTRPITVKTLAIRATAEENMVLTRSSLRNTQERMPKLLDDKGIRGYIANPQFLESPPERARLPSIHFPLLRKLHSQLDSEARPPSTAITIDVSALSGTTPPRKRVRAEEFLGVALSNGMSSEPPTKKQAVSGATDHSA